MYREEFVGKFFKNYFQTIVKCIEIQIFIFKKKGQFCSLGISWGWKHLTR